MNFEQFISRFDEDVIQEIVGKPTIKTLSSLDTDLTRISRMKRILLKIYSPIELLRNKIIRDIFFDLLKPGEAKNLVSNLGLNGSDYYRELKNKTFRSNKDLKILFEFFELKQKEEDTKKFERNIKCKCLYPLYKYQRNVVSELTDKLNSQNSRVMLHMPTGSGKTRTTMNYLCQLLRTNEPSLFIWMAHREELCEQAVDEFKKAWGFIGNRDITIKKYWANSEFSIDDLKDGFLVCGINKLYNLASSDPGMISSLADNSSLLIMDEAHMAIAPTYESTLSMLMSFGTPLLGLSATPGRTWNDPSIDEELSDFFKKKKVTLKIDGYSNPIEYLINKGYLAKIVNSPLFYSSGLNISQNDLNYLKNRLQLPDDFIKKLSDDVKRNILIIQKCEELIIKHNRIILFALNVNHSNLLAMCLQARGIDAYSLTSDTDSEQRKKVIESFKNNSSEPTILCNYGILTTGFDAPKTSCAVITRPTDSLVLYSQMVGRAIRGIKLGGNDIAEIVTVVDTCLPGFDKIENAFYNWEDVW